MRKVIAVLNMTLDGFCDHTSMFADEELHEHFTNVLRNSGVLLYGRITYQLMESYWPAVVKKTTGEKATDEFAVAIENIPKIVFSRTLDKADPIITGWKNVTLAERDLKEEVQALKQLPGKDIGVGSPSLIVALTNLNLIDEYHLCVHPIIAGKGLPLFKTISDKLMLNLIKTKTFHTGTIAVYYKVST